MDAALLSGAGIFGALTMVIFYLLASNRRDRQDYRLAIVEARKETEDERERADQERERADAERQNRMQVEDRLSAEVRKLQDQVAELQRQVARLTPQQRRTDDPLSLGGTG